MVKATFNSIESVIQKYMKNKFFLSFLFLFICWIGCAQSEFFMITHGIKHTSETDTIEEITNFNGSIVEIENSNVPLIIYTGSKRICYTFLSVHTFKPTTDGYIESWICEDPAKSKVLIECTLTKDTFSIKISYSDYTLLFILE